MLYKKLFVLMAFCMGLFLIMGCSSDEEGPVTPTEKAPDPPEFQMREMTVPDKMMNSGDAKAQLAISLIEAAQSFEGTDCVFGSPDGATVLTESKSAWEYSWAEGALTKRLAITSLASINQRKWQLYYTGSKDGVTLDEWRYMDAGQTTDLSGGHVYVYKLNTKQITLEWTWRTDGGTYTLEKYDHGVSRSKMEIVIKSDGSGKVERFVPSTTGSMLHDLLVNWTASGTGNWWIYENGMSKESGSWN
jgi:hypothetical protein